MRPLTSMRSTPSCDRPSPPTWCPPTTRFSTACRCWRARRSIDPRCHRQAAAGSSSVMRRSSNPAPNFESQLADLLGQALGLDRVSVEADFFDELGANSLSLAGYVTTVRKALGMRRVSFEAAVSALHDCRPGRRIDRRHRAVGAHHRGPGACRHGGVCRGLPPATRACRGGRTTRSCPPSAFDVRLRCHRGRPNRRVPGDPAPRRDRHRRRVPLDRGGQRNRRDLRPRRDRRGGGVLRRMRRR